MEYLAKALFNFCAGKEIHLVELAELRDRGLVRYSDSPTEHEVTEEGKNYIEYMKSADFASKRY